MSSRLAKFRQCQFSYYFATLKDQFMNELCFKRGLTTTHVHQWHPLGPSKGKIHMQTSFFQLLAFARSWYLQHVFLQFVDVPGLCFLLATLMALLDILKSLMSRSRLATFDKFFFNMRFTSSQRSVYQYHQSNLLFVLLA